MKNIVTKSGVFIAASLAILAMAAPARAEGNRMRLDIPFSFLAGEQRLPAGAYCVKFDRAFQALDLIPLKETTTCRVRVHNGRATRKADANRTVLAFRKYGETYVLRSLFVPNETESYDLKTSKTEIELAKAAAALPAGGETTIDLQSK